LTAKVTFSVVEWLPVFVNERTCRIITDSLNFCHREKGLRINAFVIMPTHLHAIVFDASFNSESLQTTLSEFRKFTRRQLCDDVSRSAPECFNAALKAAAETDRDRRFWQPTRHPVGIESETFWKQKLDYLHDNPCRKGLVRRPEHWRYSSATYYVSDGRDEGDVPISRLEW
jgi:REP element-mobilizing transposase RayT